jgi:hypothetical protein
VTIRKPSDWSFWQLGLRTIPIIATLVSTALLAYIVLSAQPSQPHAQLQQRPQQQVAQRESGPKPQAAQARTVNQPGVPNDEKLVMLIMSTLIALNQANATGNYSVFRDMGSPGFQAANSPAKLAEAFANLRRRDLDLSPILFFQPKLLRKPEIDARGMLRVTGFFPTKPERVNFDLLYQPVQGQWRLFGIAADTSRAQPAATAPVAPETAPAQEANPSPSAGAPTSTPSPTRLTAPQEPEKTPMPDIRDRLEVPKVHADPEVGASPATRPKPKEDADPFNPF